MKKRYPLIMFLFFSYSTVVSADFLGDVRIGVLAHRGIEKALKSWQPTARYLETKIPGYTFTIIPLSLDSIGRAIENGSIELIITNPASYATLEYKYGISRFLTMKKKRGELLYTQFGSVIFSRSADPTIQELADLKGKSFMAVHPNAFGGWWMAWKELLDSGIDPLRKFSKIEFNGFPQDNIVYAVLNGEVDAGTIRTGILEQMAKEKKITLSEIRVLNEKSEDSPFNFALSTELYPEWPIAIAPNASTRIGNAVTVALLNLPKKSKAAIASKIGGWTIPLDYTPVHELMKQLKVGGYSTTEKNSTLMSMIDQYRYWLLSITLSLTLLCLTIITVQKRRLTELEHIIDEEFEDVEEEEYTYQTEPPTQEYRPRESEFFEPIFPLHQEEVKQQKTPKPPAIPTLGIDQSIKTNKPTSHRPLKRRAESS